MSLHFFFFLFNEFYFVYSKFYLCFSLNCSLVLTTFSHSLMHILIIFFWYFVLQVWQKAEP